MFVRNGQALGSVQVEPKAAPKPKKAVPAEPAESKPESQAAEPKQDEPKPQPVKTAAPAKSPRR